MASQLVRQLAEEHGEYVHDGRTLHFQDGYRITFTSQRGGYSIHEIPSDEVERLQAVRKFYTLKLQDEVRDFQKFKGQCLQQTSLHARYPRSCPSPHPDSVNQLQAGKERIEALQAKRVEIDKHIEVAQEAKHNPKQRRDRQQQERWLRGSAQQSAGDLHRKISNITIDIDFQGNERGEYLEFDHSAIA